MADGLADTCLDNPAARTRFQGITAQVCHVQAADVHEMSFDAGEKTVFAAVSFECTLAFALATHVIIVLQALGKCQAALCQT